MSRMMFMCHSSSHICAVSAPWGESLYSIRWRLAEWVAFGGGAAQMLQFCGRKLRKKRKTKLLWIFWCLCGLHWYAFVCGMDGDDEEKKTAQLEVALKTRKLDQEICSRSLSSLTVLFLEINTHYFEVFFLTVWAMNTDLSPAGCSVYSILLEI